ncbi:DNA cytosine methyltransferase [uncultured Nostoc sp.]|uniref:DNA cytosine methyltransferase n=1 Tax=uncultured Nostoc sp. TaxID=340711 RepID=UPI0035CB104C
MQNSLTTAHAFSGGGGCSEGAIAAGYAPIWAIESDPYACAVYRKRFPKTLLIEADITQLSDEFILTLPVPDVYIFGSPCFTEGHMVLTDAGLKPIEDIREGDIVVTHNGNLAPVIKVGCDYKNVISLKGYGHYGVTCTPDHPFWASAKKYGDPAWLKACDLVGGYWATLNSYPNIEIPSIERYSTSRTKALPSISAEFFEVIGFWLGDGWVRDELRNSENRKNSNNGQIVFGVNENKADRLRCLLTNLGINFWEVRERTVVKIRICSVPLTKWIVANFGKGAKEKSIPTWCLGMQKDYREALLSGYLQTDGNRIKASITETYKLSTISRKLAIGVKTLASTLGMSASMYLYQRPSTHVIEGRVVNQLPCYEIRIATYSNMTYESSIHRLLPVKSISTSPIVQKVYNITVAGDSSYIVDGFAVHNCPDFSLAGKRAGIAGTRGQLFFEGLRQIKLLQPPAFLWEQVSAVLSSGGGQDFIKILDAFAEVGYVGTWQVRNGNRHVPQNRERLFCVGIHRRYQGDVTEADQEILAGDF